jgi:hypothetical protein
MVDDQQGRFPKSDKGVVGCLKDAAFAIIAPALSAQAQTYGKTYRNGCGDRLPRSCWQHLHQRSREICPLADKPTEQRRNCANAFPPGSPPKSAYHLVPIGKARNSQDASPGSPGFTFFRSLFNPQSPNRILKSRGPSRQNTLPRRCIQDYDRQDREMEKTVWQVIVA